MPAVQANPVSNLINLNHILPPRVEENEEFYYPTPEEEKAIAEAESDIVRGNFYAQRDDETVDEFVYRMLREDDYIEEFFARIDADPIGTMACNMRKNISFC